MRTTRSRDEAPRHEGTKARRTRGEGRRHQSCRFHSTLGLVLILFVAICYPKVSLAALPNGVAAGDVDQTSAVLWARSTTLGPIQFSYSTRPDFASSQTVDAMVVDVEVAVKVEITVEPGLAYYYRVTDSGDGLATGYFRTPRATGFGGLRFGVTGDWRGDLRPYPAVHNVVESNLDFLAVLGDTIYADIATPDVPTDQARTLDEMRRKNNEVYLERFGINTWADIRSTTVMYACIDDHEMTNDFCGGAPPSSDPRFDQNGVFINETDLYRNGMQAFLEYNPIRENDYGDTGDARTAGKPKLYRTRRFGSDAAIFIVDARSFRDDSPTLLERPPNAWENQAYLANAYNSARTMLGAAQFELLRADLLAAQQDGITWKFVMVPEPVQNIGPIIGSDRFEGYAFERAALLSFINDNGIENVCFIAADIHGTIVNNLVFRRSPQGAEISTDSFEVTTGSVAFSEPLGVATIKTAPPLVQGLFEGRTQLQRDRLALDILNGLLWIYGYPQVGLQGSPVDARLLEGRYMAVNHFGWSKFEIDATTQKLTVTTYGIPWYSPEVIADDPDEVLARRPEIMSRFEVDPKGRFAPPEVPTPGPALCGALGMMPMLTLSALMCLGLVARRSKFKVRSSNMQRRRGSMA